MQIRKTQMRLEIKSFFEPETCTWTYLVADTDSGEAAVIDPVWVFDPVSGTADAAYTDNILDTARDQGLTVTWVLETHAHADHLSAAGHIRREIGARVAIGRGIRSVQETFIRVFNLDDMAPDGSQFDRLLSEGDVIEVGGLEIKVADLFPKAP